MRIKKNLLSLGLMVAALAFAGSALAVTPANTQLTNQARLTYTGNATGITSSVTVTVKLVPSAVSIATTFSAPAATVYIPEHGAYSATYTVQSNANGPDTYAVATSYTATNDITGAASPTVTVSSITLGATAAETAASAGATSITVPADGVADSNLNGIAANDTVIIGADKYTVQAVTDNASGTSTITLSTALTAAVTVGEGIYEYVAFDNAISDVGAQNTGGANNYFLNLQATVTSNTLGTAKYTSNVTVNVVAIQFTKYVRDITNPVAGTGSITYLTNTYYQSGVQAQPGDTMEYLVVVTTPSSAGINSAVVSDVLPAFTTYVASSTQKDGVAVSDAGSAPIFPLDTANGGLSLGNLAASTTVNVTYRVTVAN